MARIDTLSLQGLRMLMPQARTVGTIGTGQDGLARMGDSVALGGVRPDELGQATLRMERLDLLLAELKRLTSDAAEQSGPNDRQSEIDALIASIDSAASEVGLGRDFEHIGVVNVSRQVVSYEITEADLDSPFDVEIRVRQSAQQGGLYLSMGQSVLDIGTGSSFTIEIGGTKGLVALAFTSSQSLQSITAAINSKSDESGVVATLSGTGIAIRSMDFGSRDFVSVRMLDDGGVGEDENIGIYQLDPKDTNAADPSGHDDFDSNDAANGIKDAGQDIVAAIDGEPVVGSGASFSFATPMVSGTIELTTGALDDPRGVNAQNLGDLTAMTIVVLKTATNKGAGAHAPDLPDPPDVDALRERVRSRLNLLERMRGGGVTRLAPSTVRWLGALPAAGAADAAHARALVTSMREAITRGERLSIGVDRERVLGLLGGEG
jgi:hypothetical protein